MDERPLPGWLKDWSRFALIVGVVFSLGLGIGAIWYVSDALQGFLFAWLFWMGVPMGAVILLMIHGLTGGNWGIELRPLLRATGALVPLFAILGIVIAFGVDHLYPWADNPAAAARPEVARVYLNTPAFLIRGLAILAFWSFLSVLFAMYGVRNPAVAGICLLVYVGTAIFAATDWAMSIEPEWRSTVYGALFAILQIATGTAWIGAVIWTERDCKSVPDIAGLLLANVLGLAYLAAMQYVVIWSGGIPGKQIWFVKRASGGWEIVAAAFILIGAFLPFFLLLFQGVRHHSRLAAIPAVLVLVGLGLHWLWMIAPANGREITWGHAVAPIAIGGLFFGLAFGAVGRRLVRGSPPHG